MLTLNRQKLTPKPVLPVSTILVFLVLLLSGCQGPFLVFPGGKLDGAVSQTDNFSFADAYNLVRLEVNPEAPYSVILRCVVIEGDLYLDAAPARKWGQMLADEPRVRVKLGDKLYRATAELVDDESITDRFLSNRIIYRLRPGWTVRLPEAQ